MTMINCTFHWGMYPVPHWGTTVVDNPHVFLYTLKSLDLKKVCSMVFGSKTTDRSTK